VGKMTVFSIYLRISALSGFFVGATHGHIEREKRMGPTPLPLTVVAGMRDGLLGAVLGPFAAPFVFPVATLQIVKKSPGCPFSTSRS